MLRPRDERYTTVAIILHWIIAVCIIFNLAVGYFMEGWPIPFRFMAVSLHISAGMTVLVLSVLRIIWRLLHEPPAYPPKMKSWERHLAHCVHFVLYLSMILMPLIGWSIISAHAPAGSPGAKAEAQMMATQMAPPGSTTPNPGGKPSGPPKGGVQMKIWGLIPMPTIAPIANIGAEPGGVEPQKVLHEEFIEWHTIGGFILIFVLLLHIAGALKHQIIDKDPELQRMGVGRFPNRSA